MIRWNLLAAGMAVVIGAAFVTGASLPPKPADGLANDDAVKLLPVKTQKMGFFNVPRVMREYKRAQNAVQRFTVRREHLTQNLIGMREMLRALQNTPKDPDPNRQEQTARDMLMLSRKIEDMDREVGKMLNNQTAAIISELYDEIHATTVEIAHDRGLSVVFAYPDVSTPEEMDNPVVKELKLKPQAAQPFYLDSSVDYTDELIERLNAK